MASGRFDGRKIVYLAGKKARERGRDKNITDPRRYDKLEVLRRKMAECQVNFLASPEDNPEIMEGKKEEWNKIKMEYDDLIQMGNKEDGKPGIEGGQTQSNDISRAAVRAVRGHIHNAIVYAGSLAQGSTTKEGALK
jgi:hypothetical protein